MPGDFLGKTPVIIRVTSREECKNVVRGSVHRAGLLLEIGHGFDEILIKLAPCFADVIRPVGVKLENQKDCLARMKQFYDHYLKDAPAPEWMANGVPYLKKAK